MCERWQGPKPCHHYVATGIFIIGFMIIGIFLVSHAAVELDRIGDIENNEYETTCTHTRAPPVMVEEPSGKQEQERCKTVANKDISGYLFDEYVTAQVCGEKELSLNTDAEDRICRKTSDPPTGEFMCWANCRAANYGYADTAGENAEASVLLIVGILMLLATCFGAYYFWYLDWVLLLFDDDDNRQAKEPLAMDT